MTVKIANAIVKTAGNGKTDPSRKGDKMEKKQLKPWMAVLFVAVYAADIFFLSGYLAKWFGTWGILLHEMILALLAVVLAAVLGGNLKKVFPFQKPRVLQAAGTVILWLGTFLAAMGVTIFIMYFFPREVAQASQGVEGVVLNGTLLFSLFLVALTPAVCEEIAFRGSFLSCFKNTRYKWTGILIVAVVFGMFHGSVWRCVPTAILGVALGYLLVETDNIFYSMLFHFINNAVPVLLLGLMGLLPSEEAAELDAVQVSAAHLPLLTVAMYVLFACSSPFLIYIGNYLLHRGQPGYDRGLFPVEKKRTLTILVILTFYIMAVGVILFAVSLYFATKYLIPG